MNRENLSPNKLPISPPGMPPPPRTKPLRRTPSGLVSRESVIKKKEDDRVKALASRGLITINEAREKNYQRKRDFTKKFASSKIMKDNKGISYPKREEGLAYLANKRPRNNKTKKKKNTSYNSLKSMGGRRRKTRRKKRKKKRRKTKRKTRRKKRKSGRKTRKKRGKGGEKVLTKDQFFYDLYHNNDGSMKIPKGTEVAAMEKAWTTYVISRFKARKADRRRK